MALLLSYLGLTLLPLAFVFSAGRSLFPIQSLMTAELRDTIAYLNNGLATNVRGVNTVNTSARFDIEGAMHESDTSFFTFTQYPYQTSSKRDWVTDELCHKPIDPIISKTRHLYDFFDPRNVRNSTARILNMGMPKSGSSSVSKLFKNSGFKTSHWGCGKRSGACGNCFERHLNTTSDIFRKCGNFNVYSQMDRMKNEGSSPDNACIFPQIKYLDRLYEDAPHATWLMPLRNVSTWLDSVNKWNTMRRRYRMCNFRPFLHFKGHGDEKKDHKMMALYCNHVQQIRQFIVEHPTLSLIEFRIEDPNVGSFLAQYLPVNASHWGHHNENSDEPGKRK